MKLTLLVIALLMAIASARELRGTDPSLTIEKEDEHQMLRGTLTKKDLVDKTQEEKAAAKKKPVAKKAAAKKKPVAKKAAPKPKPVAKKAAPKKKPAAKKAAPKKKPAAKKATTAKKTIAEEPTPIKKEGPNRRWLLSFLV